MICTMAAIFSAGTGQLGNNLVDCLCQIPLPSLCINLQTAFSVYDGVGLDITPGRNASILTGSTFM